jgi:hypothetical protein
LRIRTSASIPLFPFPSRALHRPWFVFLQILPYLLRLSNEGPATMVWLRRLWSGLPRRPVLIYFVSFVSFVFRPSSQPRLQFLIFVLFDAGADYLTDMARIRRLNIAGGCDHAVLSAQPCMNRPCPPGPGPWSHNEERMSRENARRRNSTDVAPPSPTSAGAELAEARSRRESKTRTPDTHNPSLDNTTLGASRDNPHPVNQRASTCISRPLSDVAAYCPSFAIGITHHTTLLRQWKRQETADWPTVLQRCKTTKEPRRLLRPREPPILAPAASTTKRLPFPLCRNHFCNIHLCVNRRVITSYVLRSFLQFTTRHRPLSAGTRTLWCFLCVSFSRGIPTYLTEYTRKVLMLA